jgi:hypothetical protein
VNKREVNRKLGLFPEELRHYVILANSFISSENARGWSRSPKLLSEIAVSLREKCFLLVTPEAGNGFRCGRNV